MNKALHVLVYVFLALAAAALYFELQLNSKRATLTDRNRMQEDYIVKFARMTEKADAPKVAAPELKKDTSPVEARLIDTPDTENVLEDYNASFETANLDTFNWDDQSTREQLREVYVLDAEGKPQMDGSEPLKNGSPEQVLLEQLLSAAKNQLARLNSTRAELVTLRGKLEGVVDELNKLKPEARQDKVTIVEKQEKIDKLEGEKAELEEQIVKVKAQVDELNTEITSLKDEVSTAKDETEAVNEELAKSQKLVEQLKKLLQAQINAHTDSSAKGSALVVLTAGDKGRIVEADNENMFAVVELDDATRKELSGKEIVGVELGVKRSGYAGAAGEFVGRVRIRQAVKDKPFVVCDILGAWEQDKLRENDTVFAD